MPKYKIADVVFEVQILYEYTKKLCLQYEYDGELPAEFSFAVTDADVAKEKALAPEFREEHLENLVILRRLCDYVLENKNGMIFHSSSIMVDGKAYLFTAPSGTGKSTHTRLWREMLGERAVMINDDKPIIRLIDGQFYVYGTPWNGKHNLGTNVKAPIKAICLLKQAKENSIRPIGAMQTIMAVLNQTVRPEGQENMSKLLTLIEKLITNVQTFLLECNISKEAAELSYKSMSKEKE